MLQGLTIAHESGNRSNESYLALNVGHLEARLGDTAAALEHVTLAVRINHDSGPTTLEQPIGGPRRVFGPARISRVGGHYRGIRT
jgi:hypothetical protein